MVGDAHASGAQAVASAPSGLLLIDKPPGATSHDVVNVVRRALGTRKVGHSGTLDPMATGLLLVGVGRATRLLRFLGELPKTYEGTGVLGVETDTLDAEGTIVRRSEPPATLGREDLRRVLGELTGDIEQVPPAFSAVKVGGERSYRAARRGEAKDAPPRSIRVQRFDLLGFDTPRFDFEVQCSGGTYVRSLVSEAGSRLGCGAHLSRLRRTAIGPFSVDRARPPEDPGIPLPAVTAVAHLPAIVVPEEEAKAASHGRILGPAGVAGPYALLSAESELIGIYRDEGGKALPEVVLAPG